MNESLKRDFQLVFFGFFFVKCYGSCCLCVSWEIAVEEGGSYAAIQNSYLISKAETDREIVTLLDMGKYQSCFCIMWN